MKNAFIIAVSLLAVSAAGAEVKNQAVAQTGEKTSAPAKQETNAPVKERVGSLFQSEAGDGISYRLAPQIRTEPGAKPVASYRSEIELRAPKLNNIVQSKMHPGIEYSGILVQAVRNNPLQLINPFAPGDGEANLVLNPVTKRVEGLKLFQVSF